VNTEEIIAMIERERATLAPCILCGAQTRGCGVWRPGPLDAELLGRPAGKYRWIVYHLCDGHDLTDPATFAAAERAIFAKLGGAYPTAPGKATA